MVNIYLNLFNGRGRAYLDSACFEEFGQVPKVLHLEAQFQQCLPCRADNLEVLNGNYLPKSLQ